MKKLLILITILTVTVLLFMACNGDETQNNGTENKQTEDEQNHESETIDRDKKGNESESASASEETDHDSQNETSAESGDADEPSKSQESHPLSEYSSEEIEYARVWLQLGPNPDIDTLYAEKIPAGEPLNPDDETSADYPEQVVQLSGTRLVDGSVTYSSNGDGTVNVYDVPKRWDGKNPAGEETYQKIIDNTTEVYIEPGEDHIVGELIKKLNIIE